MKKMRGFIDPYTLGFLIILIGATSTYFVQRDNGESTALANKSSKQVNSLNSDLSEESEI